MAKPLVAVVLGSRADFNVMKRSLETLRVMGVPYAFELASAWKTPERLTRFALTAVEREIEVIICASGGSALMAGMIATYTTVPVIAVPVDATPLRGQDALYSLVQTPPGVPVAVVGINNAENAVLLATQILANKHKRLRTVLQHMRLTAGQKLESMWKELAAEHPDLCLPERTAPDLSPSMLSDSTDTDPGDDSTPPGPASAPTIMGERIRPGATLAHRRETLNVGKPNAGALLPTPEPQEPDNQTEDPSLNESKVDTPSNPLREPAFPPPPRLSDLTPLGLSRPPATDPTESFTPPRVQTLVPPYDEDSDQEQPASTPVEKALDLAESYLETKVFHVEHSEPDEDVLAHAMMVLLEGGIVALPTDTVYGLAADATNPEAVRRLYETKGYEPSRKSLSVLIHRSDMLENLVREVPAAVESVLERYWPGGLTVLFYKHSDMLPTVSESPSIAVRIPKDALALKVLAMVERPLVVINAAVGSAPAASDAAAVIDRFDGKIDCVLDGGPCKSSETSTVLSVLTEPFEILREGTIPARDLRKILGPRLKD